MKRYCHHKKLGIPHRIVIMPYNGYKQGTEKLIRTCLDCKKDVPHDYRSIDKIIWTLNLILVVLALALAMNLIMSFFPKG